MDCPNCGFEVRRQNFEGIDISRCSECEGLWLWAPDMDRLEDRDCDARELEGAALQEGNSSDLKCPDCREQMQKFQYKYYNLGVDFCAKHGYWIDRAEEKRVLDLMRKEARIFRNHQSSIERWASILIKLRSPAFWGRLHVL